MTAGLPTCSTASRQRGDDLAGTALQVDRFLLVEQPGPWGHDALAQSRLDAAVGRELARRARACGVRVLLVRRPGRHVLRRHDAAEPLPARRWLLADCRPGAERVIGATFRRDIDLLDLPLAPGGDGGGDAVTSPLYLVCTNGTHDVCCAVRGRPVAKELELRRPGRVWETSHVGGDRFAPNVVVLPWGFSYGRVDAGVVEALTRATDTGRVLVDHLRGRCGLPAPAQAAARFAAARLGLDGVGDLAVVACDRLGPQAWRVRLRGPDGDVQAFTVQATASGEPVPLTCRAAALARPLRFEVLAD